MKFALINTFYAVGSTGRTVKKNKARLEALGHEVKAFYGAERQAGTDSNVYYIGVKYARYIHMMGSKYLGMNGMLSNIPTTKLLRALDAYQPDVIWLSGLHGYYLNWYRLFRYIKREKILTVYGMPDEFAFVGKCCSSFECEKYRTGCHHCEHLKEYPPSLVFDNSKQQFNRKKRAYKGLDHIIFRSAPYVVEKARQSALLRDKELYTTDSTVDIKNIFHPQSKETTYALRESLHIPQDAKVALLCAKSSDPHKGAEFFLEAAEQCEKDNIYFVQVSFDGDRSVCPGNFITVDFISDQNRLAEFYSMADVYVCTSKSDAQPNTCLEAMGCGTPIIGFRASGVPYVTPPEFGTFVEPFRVDLLVDAIRAIPKKTEEYEHACHAYANGRFSVEAAQEKFEAFIDDLEARVHQAKRIKNK